MKIIDFGSEKYLIGLDWKNVEKKELKKAFVDFSKQNKDVKYSVITNFRDKASIGLIHDSNKKPAHHSALAHLALANAKQISSNTNNSQEVIDVSLAWICVEELSDKESANENKEYWIGVVVDGQPFAKGDAVVKEKDIKEEVLELVQTLKLLGNVNIFTPKDEIKALLVSELYAEENVHFSNTDFISLVESVKYDAVLKRNIVYNSNLIYALLGFGVLGAAYFGYNYYEEWKAEREAIEYEQGLLLDKQQLEQALLKYEKDKREALEKSIQDAENSLNEMLTRVSFGQTVESFNKLIGNLKIEETSGWDKKSVECSIQENIPKCTIHFTRTPEKGTIASIIKTYPSIEIIENGDEAKLDIDGAVLNREDGNYHQLFDINDFKVRVVSKLQSLEANNIEKEIGVFNETSFPITIPDAPNGISQPIISEVIKLGVSKGSFKLSGDGLYRFHDLKKHLENHKLYLNKFSLDFNEHKWEIQGEYFIKTNESNVDKIILEKAEIIQ